MVKSSKRATLKNKYKAQKKIKDHNSKVKKLAKLNPDIMQRRKKEDPGVPNLWPFKAAMLKDVENERIEAREKLERERAVKRALREREKVAAEQSKKREIAEYQRENTVEGKRKWYYRELMKVVEASDVILEVLDARDPIGCRALEVERRIAGMLNDKGYPTKKIVLVLNKIDMVPPEVVNNWVSYLRREHPTIAFKASTHKHRGHMNRLDVKSSNASQKALDAKSSVGAPALLQLLKNYCRSQDLKKGLTVGIIGYPNVGKSSVVNSLKMMRAVQVSSNAGCTKTLQQVRLDSNIMLVDSPGVLFAADEENSSEESQRGLLLRNALRLDQIEDPINAIQGILERCTTEQLMKLYSIAEFTTPHEFLIFVAHRRGKLGKGGVPQIDEAARTVIQDWNEGKIPFYTLPPVTNDIQESVVVSKWAEEFDINALLDSANQQTVRTIYENGMNMHSGDGMGDKDDEEDIDFDEQENDDDDDDMDHDTYAQMYGNSNLVVEESDDDEDEAQKAKNAAIEARKQERMHPIDMVPLRNLKVGRSKASKVLDKDYDTASTQAPTKQQKKAAAKKEKKKAAIVQSNDMDDSDYDYNEY